MTRILIYYLRHDDPKKNTALKMIKHGYAKQTRNLKKTIILTPFSPKPITPSDKTVAERIGLTIIDGSWPKTIKILEREARKKHARRLPLLLAANPINYAKIAKLSSIEAAAAALYILGYREKALAILSLYKWGPVFYTLNKELLDEYSTATSEDDIINTECNFLKHVETTISDCDRKTIETITRILLSK